MGNGIVIKAVMGIIGVFVVLFFAMVEDVQSRKIRNVWVFFVFLLNGVLVLAKGGVNGLTLYVGKTLFWLGLLYMLYYLKALGAGDVKLLAVLLPALKSTEMDWFMSGGLMAAAAIAVYRLARGEYKEYVPLALPIWVGYFTVLMSKGGLL